MPRGLTRWETEVLQLLSEGLTRREAADRMFVHVSTVKAHMANALPKLSARTTAQAVAIAVREGLLDEDGCE
jgi:DNA-binding NarL/FixJ family response regulator